MLEACAAIADGRVKARGNCGLVVSSEGDRVYHVYVNASRGEAYSDDNGTKLRGYVGYPIISMLMLQGVLPFDEAIAKALSGIPWRRLNEHYRKYALVEREVKRIAESRGVPASRVDAYIRSVLSALSRIRLRLVSLPLECLAASY